MKNEFTALHLKINNVERQSRKTCLELKGRDLPSAKSKTYTKDVIKKLEQKFHIQMKEWEVAIAHPTGPGVDENKKAVIKFLQTHEDSSFR